MLKKLTLIMAVIALAATAQTTRTSGTVSRIAPRRFDHPLREDFSVFFLENDESRWSANDRRTVETVLRNTFHALNAVGLDGEAILSGYRFVHDDGEFARDKAGKIAVVNHVEGVIILAAPILQPENVFFIYHELGHIIDHRSGRALNHAFHSHALATGAQSLHEWTTAQGFFLRGQAHIKHTEATADAFALWVWVDFAGHDFPTFHDTPENADPAAILAVFKAAIAETAE